MEWQKFLTAVGPVVVAALVTWGGLAARRAFRNVGRTEEEIALEEYRAALEEVRLAKATNDGGVDDAKADAHVKTAKKTLDAKKRLRAIFDAAGEE